MTQAFSPQPDLHVASSVMDCEVAIVGGGPAGLMAAERLSAAGRRVCVFDTKASVGRKFLMAGKGGMNLTHSEPFAAFVQRYGSSAAALAPLLEAFGPQQVCDWVKGLGLETFVGSSGRVFPTDMKAAPLLRLWMGRLRQQGVRFCMRHRWVGWAADGSLHMQAENGEVRVRAQAVLLALGGGSWARLGSDGAWLPLLQARGIAVAPLQPSNCGFDVARVPADGEASASGETRRAFLQSLVGQPEGAGGWTPFFRERFAGSRSSRSPSVVWTAPGVCLTGAVNLWRRKPAWKAAWCMPLPACCVTRSPARAMRCSTSTCCPLGAMPRCWKRSAIHVDHVACPAT